MRLDQPIRRARIACITAAVFATSVPGFAQGGQSPLMASLREASAKSAAQMQRARSGRLSIDDAVKLAVEQNLGIRIQRVDPQIQDTGVALARAKLGAELLDQRQPRRRQPARAGHHPTELFERHQQPWPGTQPVCSVGRRQLHAELEQPAPDDDKSVQQLQPAAVVEPAVQLHPAAAAELFRSTRSASRSV